MKRVLIAVALLGVLGIALGGWALWTMRGAEQHLTAARADLLDARSAIAGLDAQAAQTAVDSAAAESSAAAELAGRLIWSAAAGLPKVGDTPAAARSLVLAADAAVNAVSGLAAAASDLSSDDLIEDGQVNLDAVGGAGDAALLAQGALDESMAHLADMPAAASGAWVVAPIEDARAELTTQVQELASATESLERVGSVLPGLLGDQGPKTYFVAVQAPNETRGTGGLVGTWAVVRAENGRVSVVDVGSNGDLPSLDAMPDEFGEQYLARYSDDPTLVPNMNISPDFPAAAKLWLASWEQKTGERLDGALGIDVTAVGELLQATDVTVTTPDGQELSGDEFADFTLRGIYEIFPTGADVRARKDYQEVLAEQALAGVLAGGNPVALARSLSDQVADRRIALWVPETEVQSVIAETGLAHSLAPAQPHSVEPVIINIGWSKLDTYIDRKVEYTVGRCPDPNGEVRSSLTTTLTSDIPGGVVLPEYVVGAVPVGPDGPVNAVVLQTHLPPGAVVSDVYVDGENSEFWEFMEADRPAVGYILDLQPRESVEVRIVFFEPGDAAPGEVRVQPMARGAEVVVSAEKC